MNITLTLVTLRKIKEVTQKEVANALHIERSTYTKLEYGTSGLGFELAVKIADYYGMEINYFALCMMDTEILNDLQTLRLIVLKKMNEIPNTDNNAIDKKDRLLKIYEDAVDKRKF